MAISNNIRPGRHFLQIPGPTNVPDRVLRAMDYPTIDHRGPDFAELGLRVLDRIKLIFKTSEPVIIFPASGTGAWEAAIVNTLSVGDKILMFERGAFSSLCYDIAENFTCVFKGKATLLKVLLNSTLIEELPSFSKSKDLIPSICSFVNLILEIKSSSFLSDLVF